jgi:hypothetical protein
LPLSVCVLYVRVGGREREGLEKTAAVTSSLRDIQSARVARARTGQAGSYQEIVGALLGPRAEVMISVLQVVYLTGCNVVMLIIMRDQIKPVLAHMCEHVHCGDLLADNTHGWLLPLIAWVVCFPLSLIRDMSWCVCDLGVLPCHTLFARGSMVATGTLELTCADAHVVW